MARTNEEQADMAELATELRRLVGTDRGLFRHTSLRFGEALVLLGYLEECERRGVAPAGQREVIEGYLAAAFEPLDQGFLGRAAAIVARTGSPGSKAPQ